MRLLLFVGFSAVRFTVILQVRCFVLRIFFPGGRAFVLVVPWDHALIAFRVCLHVNLRYLCIGSIAGKAYTDCN